MTGFQAAETVNSRVVACALCIEFAYFIPVYSEDIFDRDVQNLK